MVGGSFWTRLSRMVAPLAVLGIVGVAPGSAEAHRGAHVAYFGAHPVHGGSWCNDGAQHYHDFEPEDYYLYSEYDGVLYFIGDPVDFGWSGDTHAYWDHHRLDVPVNGRSLSVGYCYLPGPHHHYFAPPVTSYYHIHNYNGLAYYYWYDYDNRPPLWDTRHLAGWYTRFGPVEQIIREPNHALAIIGPGEEVHMEFIAPTEAPPNGWTRYHVFKTEGWCKDMDLYTLDPDTLEPLPGDKTPERTELHERYNTRFRSGR
jgi:hypothetical protein